MTAKLQTFADLIFHHALTMPEKPAIVLADRVVTYGMVAQGIVRVERRLRALDLAAGALVCVTLASPIRHLIAAAALFRLGHPMMSAATPNDAIALALPVVAFLEGPGAQVVLGQRQVIVGDDWFDGGDEEISSAPARGHADGDAICRVDLSSGTTGRPKAISFTLANFNNSQNNYYQTINFALWERLLCLPGLTNNWGFTVAAHTLWAGRTLVFTDSARGALQMISLYEIDLLVASSQQLRDMVRAQIDAPVPVPSLRGVMTGGSLVTQALMTDARANICTTIVNQYGSTEAGATAFATIDSIGEVEGATGYIAPWAQVEVVDEAGKVLPRGEEGTLRILGSGQGAPYPPGRPDDSGSFKDGWFYSGDRGRILPNGLLVLAGRTSDIINAGGVKIAPEIVEDMLKTHPAVQDAAAFGHRSGSGIEEIGIAVVSRAGLDEAQLINWCRRRNLPVGRVWTVASLPKTTLGKINRDELRKQLLG
jgi:acyl-CoA synthetase (AMP-forming)/AMP-acid ligase II